MPPWPVKLERGCIPLRLPFASCIWLGQGQTQLPWGVPMTFAARRWGRGTRQTRVAGAAQRGAAAPHPTARPAPLAGNYLITTWDMWRAAIPY